MLMNDQSCCMQVWLLAWHTGHYPFHAGDSKCLLGAGAPVWHYALLLHIDG
jgi:hypothetical protein